MAVAFGLSMASAQEQSMADKLYLQIMQAYKAQDWQEVVNLVRQVADAGENIEEFEVTYAQALSGTGEYQQAYDRLDDYVAKYPGDYSAWTLYADLCSRLGMNEKAVEAYDHCSELHPEIAKPWTCSARALRESDPDAAITRYKRAIRLYIDGNRLGNAIQLGSEALAVTETDTELLMLLGEALDKASMPNDALTFYAEVVAQNAKKEQPDVAQVAGAEYAIAKIYYGKGDYEKTMSFLNSAIDNEALLSGAPEVLVNVMCLASAASDRLGNAKDAEKYLQKARAVDPAAADAAVATLANTAD